MRQARPGDCPAVRIEPDNEWAWRGEERLELPPKTFAVLRHLVEHRERLVTKDELLAAVWGDTIVSEASLTSCIRDLRKALDDSSRSPRYIETVHRRGFRFIGRVGAPVATPAGRPSPAIVPPTDAALVGRDAELARLHAAFETALAGQRRVVFVTGEAGIGKTALVEAFLSRIGDPERLRIARGQCVEHYGASEAYLPLLEALGRMGRESAGEALVRILRQHAPTWLEQLPALLSDRDLEAVQLRAHGTTRERMLRELIDAFDALSLAAPVVLLLEDLHWSDAATIDLLAMLARRRDAARVLVLGTYRPAEVAAAAHPLRPVKQELHVHGYCEEIALDFLSEPAVGDYLDRRFPSASYTRDLAPVLHANTSGNPLFLVNMVDELIAQGHVREVEGRWELSLPVERIASTVPHTLWQMVESQLERLAPVEQAMLAIGSVAGAEFSAALSTADGIDARDGERCCEALVRRGQFLRAAGVAEWPDGTVASRYAFIHALYRNVLYERVSIGHRVGLHLRIGARLERAHGARSGDIAGELAMHFEHGRDFERAVDYRRRAADGALGQHAYREATSHASRALQLLAALPQSPERSRQELGIQTALGAAAIATSGWGAPEVARAYARARELCAEVGLTPQVFPVLLGLAGFYLMRGELRSAQEVSAQLLAHATATHDPAGLLGAHNTAGMAAFYRGEFAAAVPHFEQSSEIYDPHQHGPNRRFSVDHDPRVSFAAHHALTLLMLGYADRAAAHMRECLAHARAIDHPLSVAMGYNFAEIFYQARREPRVVRELEEVRLDYSTKHDFALFLLLGEIHRGWLAAEEGRREEGLAQIRNGLASYQAVGAELGRPTFLGIAAEVCGQLGRHDEALAIVDQAIELGEQTGLHYWDAELQRLKGTLELGSRDDAAESSFLAALEIARRQEGKFFELRAATSLARLWRRKGETVKARGLLSEVFGWFTEGFDTPDLRDAKSLLAELADGAKRPARTPERRSRSPRR